MDDGPADPRPLPQVAQEVELAGGRERVSSQIVARLVREAREAGREEGRALAQAEGLALRLPVGEALCGIAAPEPSVLEQAASWIGSGVVGVVVGAGVVITWWNVGPAGLVAGAAACTWAVWAVSSVAGAYLRAKARQHYWVPEVAEDGGYLARVGPDGRVQVRARKGKLAAWRPAETFGIVRVEEDEEGAGAQARDDDDQ